MYCLAFACFFCQFQPGVAYKSVAYKKIVQFYLTNLDVFLFDPQFYEKETALLIVWLQNDRHENENMVKKNSIVLMYIILHTTNLQGIRMEICRNFTVENFIKKLLIWCVLET